jgi:hypothetical protein
MEPREGAVAGKVWELLYPTKSRMVGLLEDDILEIIWKGITEI